MNTAFQKVYTKITQITKATCSLKAQGVGNDELAIVKDRKSTRLNSSHIL